MVGVYLCMLGVHLSMTYVHFPCQLYIPYMSVVDFSLLGGAFDSSSRTTGLPKGAGRLVVPRHRAARWRVAINCSAPFGRPVARDN